MESHAASATVEPEAALRVALGTAGLGAVVCPSAIDAARHIAPGALQAVAAAAAATSIRIREVTGITNPEEPGWVQILLTVDDPGDAGSARWRASLATAGSIIEAAIEARPDLAHAIASQVSFDL